MTMTTDQTANQTCPKCGTPLATESKHATCPKCLLGLAIQGDAGSRRVDVSTSAYQGEARHGWTISDLESRFPQLEILSLIGQGGMGAVYRVRQKALDRVVALKVLPARSSGDPSFEERFVREARTLAKLSHPNIVTVFEFGEQEGLYFFLMEYVDGVNLRSLMSDGSLTSGEALSIVGQVCDALQYAHEMAIVHRDIKPENVLIDQRGQVKIADFGLAKILEKPAQDLTLTGVHQVVGTPHYMAPEQMERPTEVDHRADIYSLGVVFYELLTGELPLGRFAPPSKRADVQGALDDVVMRTLEKEPAERYQQVNEIKTDCSRIAAGGAAASYAANHGVHGDDQPQQQDRQASSQQTPQWEVLTAPCTLPSKLEGIYDYVGLLKLDDKNLTLQYRGQEGFTGSSPLGAKELVMPLERIATIEFKRGMGKHTVYITPSDLMMIDKVPGFDSGRVVTYFARNDRAVVESLVAECGRRGNVRTILPAPIDAAEALKSLRLPAIGMAAFALLSLLALLGVSGAAAVSNSFVGLGSLELSLLGGSTLMYCCFQMFILFGAIQMYWVRNRTLATAAAVSCCLPVTPWSLFGIGMGIWALVVMRRDEVADLFNDENAAAAAMRPRPTPASNEVEGKPQADEHLRKEAAERLRIPLTALRFAGGLSFMLLALGALFIFRDGSLVVTYELTARTWWGLTAGGAAMLALIPGCFLVLANTNSSRGRLIRLSVLGLMPITLVWPLTVVFACWALLILMDPDVKQLHQRGPLTYARPCRRVLGFVLAAVVAIPIVGLSMWRDYQRGVKAGSEVRWLQAESLNGEPLTDKTISQASEILHSRFEECSIPFSISEGDSKRRIRLGSGLDPEKVAQAKRISEVIGKIELAVLRESDDDSLNAVTTKEPSDMLPYVASDGMGGIATGLRVAVLTNSRIQLTDDDIREIYDHRRSKRGSEFEVDFENIGHDRLTKQWKSLVEKLDVSFTKPMKVALLVDGKVHGVGSIEFRANKRLHHRLKLSGQFPLDSGEEWRAVLRYGPLPARFTLNPSKVQEE